MTAEQLAQQYDLLIANGQLTADTLIALSENEIDADYFAVTSTNEARGTEVECELSITEFALRATENVRALLDELERKDKRIAEMTDERTVSMNELSRIIQAETNAKREALQRIAELEARTVTVKLPTAFDLTGETDGNCSLNDASMKPDVEGCYFRRRDVESACAAAGINLTVEG